MKRPLVDRPYPLRNGKEPPMNEDLCNNCESACEACEAQQADNARLRAWLRKIANIRKLMPGEYDEVRLNNVIAVAAKALRGKAPPRKARKAGKC